ncbi:hypothetical protein AK812_SmicGene30107 [Symbiodinium microadriaticum]|uniref:Uncharacterized protein n=1 Tax=Symbiodinium microadriaticum TaxID=2951 RepID=A0A1Q9D057_SYMMI|nr:hypothetical protein AK812_SmicGene30107 [Symbiodinium microadriaticum]
MTNIMYSELDIEKECDLPDTMMLRALMVFMAYGMVKKTIIVPALSSLRSQNWMAFLYFLVFMACNEKIMRIEEELLSVHGTSKTTVHRWQIFYQNCLTTYMNAQKLNKVGGHKRRCVMDEIAVGKVGVRVDNSISKLRSMTRRPVRISKREPYNSIWKRGARPGVKVKAKSAKDKRKSKNTQWLWFGVEYGKDKFVPFTHGAGTKRVAATVLPSSSSASDKKPRGHDSIKQALQKYVLPKSKVTADGWRAIQSACKSLKIPLKQVNHTNTFRGKDGTYSNDAESEVARFKFWSRGKWSKVRSTNSKCTAKKQAKFQAKVTEYVVQTNSACDMKLPMSIILEAIRLHSKSKKWSPVLLE